MRKLIEVGKWNGILYSLGDHKAQRFNEYTK